jgi:uncharacterized protein
MPVTEIKPITAHEFNIFLADHKLMGSQCGGCQSKFLPPRQICPVCHQHNMTWVEFSGQARLEGFTSIYIGSSEMVKAGYGKSNPYVTGIVKLEEGPAISARILGLDPQSPERITIGTPLRVTYLQEAEGDTSKTILAFTAR